MNLNITYGKLRAVSEIMLAKVMTRDAIAHIGGLTLRISHIVVAANKVRIGTLIPDVRNMRQ